MTPLTPQIFFVCSGLGHVYRGYETFTRQCFDALRNEPTVRVQLFKGAGTTDALETRLPVLRRTQLLSRLAGMAVLRSGYVVEQLSFAMALIPFLRRRQPDVVFFSDRELGTLLWHWRKRSKANFKLLFSNGSPAPPPFPLWDHVHQVSPEHYERALQAGVDRENQSLVPYGYEVPGADAVLRVDERISIRERLGLPTNRPIIISVGMISAAHKRMDYVVREIASMPAPRPFLLLLGQFVGSETQRILELAGRLLGTDGCRVTTVHPDAICE
jgi:1,2-diacylglycerol 3-alpha-glucosyltransferase